MKKSITVVALGIALAAALCACGPEDPGAASSAATSGTGADTASSAQVEIASGSEAAESAATPEGDPAQYSEDEAFYMQLLEQNLDMAQYTEAANGFASDNRLKAPVESVTVDGKALSFGAAYDEAISALGSDISVPEGLADMETSGSGLSTEALSSFKTADGAAFSLGFTGTEGAPVKEGVLATAGNRAVETPAEMYVNGVGTGSTMQQVVAAFGNPAEISGETSTKADGSTASLVTLRYLYTGNGTASQVRFTFDHDSVVTVDAQGPMA